MEYALRGMEDAILMNVIFSVLILVLMEYALRELLFFDIETHRS